MMRPSHRKRPGGSRSRAFRERRDEAVYGPILANEVLKEIYYDGLRRPAWARLAFKQGWMTRAKFYALKQTERVPRKGFSAMLYANNPLFKLLKRDDALLERWRAAAGEEPSK